MNRRYWRCLIDGFPRISVAPWTDPLANDANFAVVSWGKRQMCREFDADVVRSYVDNNHGSKSGAPEASMAGGANPDNPVRPDGDGPFLFPPLAVGTSAEEDRPEEASS